MDHPVVQDDDFAGSPLDSTPRELAVVMITAPRRGPGYLARSLASLHSELKNHYVEYPVPINVCFSDAEEHNELSTLLPLPSSIILHNLTSPVVQKHAQNKEVKCKMDFVTCIEKINASLHPQTSQVIFLEDDVILMKDFFPTLFTIINLHRDKLRDPIQLLC